VRVFAPGFPESEVCNPLDFLKDETDSLMARQIAEVLNRNFNAGNSNASDDPFFTNAGDQLTEAILMLAKSSRYSDIMMCQALLSLKDLPQRLEQNLEKLDPWIHASFGQLISVGQSEKTVASIVATANANFTKFMKADLLGAFCGETTLPLDLQGKQLLILGMDRERREIVAPLVATLLHLLVNRNVSRPRQDPLILALDEVPTLYLPALVHWLNENREDDLACLLGFQNLAQLEKTYGQELARAILGGCATKAIFNPQEYESARLFSDFLGEEEIHYQQKSRGRSGGQANINRSEQDRSRKLFEPSQFLKLPTGACIFINPAYRTAREAAVPLHQSIRISQAELRAVRASEKNWKTKQQDLQHQRQHRPAPEAADLKLRYVAADHLLPLQQPDPRAATAHLYEAL
jgi:type IV secretory pathway TraG/TraD family ATPase VirD4